MPEQLVQLDQLSEDVRKFWGKKQEELGEGLVKFSYGILMNSKQPSAPEKCGVIYLMEKSLYFEDFYKAPLFFQTKAQEFTKTQIRIPRVSITEVEILRQKGFEKRFFGQEPSSGLFQNILNIFHQSSNYLVITETQDTGSPQTHIFRDLDDPELWLGILRPKEP
ncbi:MAG: hypothetical protein GY801_28130 [bacterium]|nr:hypothetical protein [bacterium]